jgi:hypothetical protein
MCIYEGILSQTSTIYRHGHHGFIDHYSRPSHAFLGREVVYIRPSRSNDLDAIA